MWCGGSLLLFTAWLASFDCRHDTKRFAEIGMQEDPLRRRTMQSLMVGMLGIRASTTIETPAAINSIDTPFLPTHSLFKSSVKHPFACVYTLQPPAHATLTKKTERHVQWTLQGWMLDVVLQAVLPTTDWNELVQQRLLQVQHDEDCFVTCREEPFRLSSNTLELAYTTTHRPLHFVKRREWKTRMYWNSGALSSVHCHGRILPERSVQAVLESIEFR